MAILVSGLITEDHTNLAMTVVVVETTQLCQWRRHDLHSEEREKASGEKTRSQRQRGREERGFSPNNYFYVLYDSVYELPAQ